MKNRFYSLVLNLTAHTATLDQIADGLEDVDDVSQLKAYLDVPEEALTASDAVLDGILDGKVHGIISTFILPIQAERIQQFAESLALSSFRAALGAAGPADTISDILNAARSAFSFRAMVGGAPILMERLIPALESIGVVPVYSLSARVSQDEIQPDGSTRKVSVHRHIRFRAARKP